MDIREFFYWVASISLILIALFTIVLFVILFYIKRLADKTTQRILAKFDDMSDKVSSASKAWRNIAFFRFILRALRYII